MIFPKPFIQLGNRIFHTHRTPDEREILERRKQALALQRHIQREQQAEVKYFAKAIPTWLARMGHAYWYKKKETDPFKGRYNPIRIDAIQIGPDAYFFRIDTKRLPRGVKLADLKSPETLETLTGAAGSKVEFHFTRTGCWYSIETRYGRGSIPAMVGYAELLKQMAADAAPLAFPLGMGENQRPFVGDMAQMINLLVGGTKGGGKSNAINVLLCTLLSRNSPANLRVFLTDLKGGIEFADYRGIPHLGGDVAYYEIAGPKPEDGRKKPPPAKIVPVPPGFVPKEGQELRPPLGQEIATEPHQTLPVLRYIEAELDRRARLLAGKAKKIATYNKRYPDRALSVWLVVIDELATLMEDRRYSQTATFSLSEIARKGRAVGIFLILATQTPTSAIVPSQIANNMDARLAFRTGSGTASGVLLGSGEYDAEKLPNLPGRFIFKWGGDKTQMQAPYIADGTVRKIIAEVKSGQYTDAREAELAQKAEHLFGFALRQLNGECHSDKVYSFIKADGYTRREVRDILERYEVTEKDGKLGPEIVIEDTIYYLAPAIIPLRIARWLVPAGEFLAGKHPNPDYNFELLAENGLNLARRTPNAEESPDSVYPETQKSEKSAEPAGESASHPVNQLPSQPVTQLTNLPDGDGELAPAPMAEPASEDDALEDDELAATDDELIWTSAWHHLDDNSDEFEEDPSPDDENLPAWILADKIS